MVFFCSKFKKFHYKKFQIPTIHIVLLEFGILNYKSYFFLHKTNNHTLFEFGILNIGTSFLTPFHPQPLLRLQK
jgi:hypothetical protein